MEGLPWGTWRPTRQRCNVAAAGRFPTALTRVADQTLPAGFGIAWTDLAYQQLLTGNTAAYVFALSVLFVFLTLAAQFESWALPFAIILIVPMCILFA